MLLLGVTGGPGMGKSASGEILKGMGYPVADTDLIAREVVDPGQPALEAIRREFGPGVFGSGGRLDREKLAEIVFSDANTRQRLEAILHPRIRAEWERRVGEWKAKGLPMGVVVIPLLFETRAEELLDSVVCVACTAETQKQRLKKRGWSDSQLQGRMAAQLPIETKIGRADFVIWSEPPLSVHATQLRCVLRSLGIAG